MDSDNFMWFPEGAFDVRPIGETTDAWFSQKGAFEVWDFKFDFKSEESTDESSGGGAPGKETAGKPAVRAEKSQGGTGGGAGKTKFESFSISKVMDTASAVLARACATGVRFPTIMLAIRKSGGSHLIYLQFMFRDCQVTGITWSGGSGKGGTEGIKEEMKFTFKAMAFRYYPQDAMGKPVGGKNAKPQEFRWNTTNDRETIMFTGESGPAPEFLKPWDGTD